MSLDSSPRVASELLLEANRRNAILSTGPVTDAGKAIASRNALSHGLTAKSPVLPGDSEQEYLDFVSRFVQKMAAGNGDPQVAELAAEYADLRWRLRRAPRFEVRIIALEMRNLLLASPEHQDLPREDLQALAYMRLIERKVLTNLYHQEARLQRRADRVLRQLLDLATAPPPPVVVVENRKNEPDPPPPIIAGKVGRNEPCPCGSNLKYKRCCGNPVPRQAAAA